jgi:hypothetical protein
MHANVPSVDLGGSMWTRHDSPMRHLGLRIPDELHEWLTDLADREHRSLNGQVLVILERARAETANSPTTTTTTPVGQPPHKRRPHKRTTSD